MKKAIYYIASLFSTNANVKRLQNNLACFAIDYQKAVAKIAEARRTFEETKEHTVADFESKKKATIEETKDAVDYEEENICYEEEVLDAEYAEAKDKINEKRNSIANLQETLSAIGGKEYPLE